MQGVRNVGHQLRIFLAARPGVLGKCGAFKRVDDAVGAKQAYETTQIKKIFHGDEGKKDMEVAVKRTEAERAPLVEAIKTAFVPVKHTIKIQAAE